MDGGSASKLERALLLEQPEVLLGLIVASLRARIDLETGIDSVLLVSVDSERHLTQIVSVGKVASSRVHVRHKVLIGALNL